MNLGSSNEGRLLADRLGITRHVSPLRRKVSRLMEVYPAPSGTKPEAWLMDLANARGARVIQASVDRVPPIWTPPSADEFANEEIVAALLVPETADFPQTLRLAAQLVSQRAVNVPRLLLLVEQERGDRALAELARLALRVEPDHPVWRTIHAALASCRPFATALIHWTRLAEPIMKRGTPNAHGWRLAT